MSSEETESVHVGRHVQVILRWSYGGGNPGLIRPNGYRVERVGAFLVLHCAAYCKNVKRGFHC